jgi:hypothetical protein
MVINQLTDHTQVGSSSPWAPGKQRRRERALEFACRQMLKSCLCPEVHHHHHVADLPEKATAGECKSVMRLIYPNKIHGYALGKLQPS